MKKVLVCLLTICLLVSMTACSVNYKSTSTTTTTTTDANGNTTTTTTTTTNENGQVSESTETVTTTSEETAEPTEDEIVTCAMLAEDGEVHTFPFKVTNMTKYPIISFYTVPAGKSLENASDLTGEDVLDPGASFSGDFGYNKENLVFDFVICFSEDDPITFSGLDFSGLRADIDLLALEFTEKEDGTFHIGVAQ